MRGLGGVALARHSATDPAVELAERAAREALTQAGVEMQGLPTFLGCSKGAVVALERAAQAVHRKRRHADDFLAVALGPHGYLTHHLQQRLGIEPRTHCVAACASSLVALDRARQALLSGQITTALVVSSEAALLPMFIHSYARLGVLAPQTVVGYRGRPLDARRNGFMLAEAGVAVVLQTHPPTPEASEEHSQAARSPGPRSQNVGFARQEASLPKGAVELVDTACFSEAYDMIRSPADMTALRQIAEQLMAGRPISMLHPHAPATADHDATELQTLAEVLGAQREAGLPGAGVGVGVYASKGALGHTLGSAGLVSVVLACLMLRTKQRPPMPWLEEPMPSGLALRQEGHAVAPGHHAIFAAGFGGHTAGAIIGHGC